MEKSDDEKSDDEKSEDENKKINFLDLERLSAIYNVLTADKNKDNISNRITNFINKIYENDICNNEFNQICNDISNVPIIEDVLRLHISYKEKYDIIEKIVLLHNLQPISSEFFELRNTINNSIRIYSSRSMEDYEKYKQLEMVEEAPEYKILNLDMTNQNKAFIYNRYKQLMVDPSSQISNKIRDWLRYILNIPTKIKPLSYGCANEYLYNVKRILDEEVYGLQNVKERILFILNNKITNPSIKGISFGLVGPPGVAKTSIINALVKAVDLPFFQINAGGMKDSSFLLGHGFAYEGSMPGCICQALLALKQKNGIIYFDEFDKISTTVHGLEISRTLLHITDFSQNSKFHDRYIGEQFDIDISNIWFIYSLNDKNMIEPTLRDRISIIEIEGYDDKDKKIIATDFLLPKALKNIGMEKNAVIFAECGLNYLIEITKEHEKSGVRRVKHLIEEILMKINFLITTHGKRIDMSFNIENFALPIILTKKIIIDLNIKLDKDDKHLSMYS